MCILCVVQRWSRRVATMLPWLVIPLIVLWALSQLLPPALRFEITSPRLACVFVLLATLFWYEILMPHLSSWRARRSARLRERRRTEALELQKLRKTATRRCRNCNMSYREQNPGGGRFMCSYCGHISKRPALDLPDQIESPGIFTDVVGKNGWLCYGDGTGNWSGPGPKHWNGSDHPCSTEKSDSGVILFACKLLSFFLSSVRWLRGKIFRLGSREDASSDSDHRGLSEKGEDGVNLHESRGDKARRKAEEKRQARLEKEMLEEEERKQREEVARLVDERRRLRDETLAAETERSKGSAVDEDRDGRKEINKRKRDRRKDKDKTSSKSNSDGEELEKRASREIEKKQEFEKKSENECRDSHKGVVNSYKPHSMAGVCGSKVAVNKSRYFDRMKGSFLYPSRGFSGPFFGRNIQNTTPYTKSVKPVSGFIDHSQNSANRRDGHPVVHAVGKPASNAGDKASETNLERPAAIDTQPKAADKKSWQHLFTRSSVVSPDPDANSTKLGNSTGQLADRGDQSSKMNVLPSYSTIDNQVDYNKSLPITAYPPTSKSFTSNSFFHNLPDTTFPPLEEPSRISASEDAEFFEDPCYVPDAISLLGPVSESLDNLPSHLVNRFSARNKNEGSPYLINALTSADVNKPSPIEPPLPKLHFPEGKHCTSDPMFSTPKSDTSIQGQSTWQMWGSPLAQEGLGLIERPSSWFSPLVHGNSQQPDFLQSLSSKPIVQPISKSNSTLPGLSTQHARTGEHEKICGTHSPLGYSFNASGIWQQKSTFQSPPLVNGDDHLLPFDLMDNISGSEATYSSPVKSTTVPPFSTQPANNWSKDLFDEAGNLMNEREDMGSFFSRGPDIPSVWPFRPQ